MASRAGWAASRAAWPGRRAGRRDVGAVGDGAGLLEVLDDLHLPLVPGPQGPSLDGAADGGRRDLATGHAVVEAGDLFEGLLAVAVGCGTDFFADCPQTLKVVVGHFDLRKTNLHLLFEN